MTDASQTNRRVFLAGASAVAALPAAGLLVGAPEVASAILLESLRIDAGMLGPFGTHP